jgi:hypothetical protein
MKKTCLLIIMIAFAFYANAQTRIGYMTQSYTDKIYGTSFQNGDQVYYITSSKNKVQLYCASEWGAAIPESYVRSSGFYYGMIVDPVDNYVNVRKGPGTNYPIVTKVNTDEFYCFKKTNTNWVKLYTETGKYLGYIYKNRIDSSSPTY